MRRKDEAVIESLLVGGLIGAALGALLSKNKNSGSLLGGIAGAAMLASLNASEQAKRTEIPLVIEEDDALYEVYNDGTKKLLKHLPKSKKNAPKKFTLK